MVLLRVKRREQEGHEGGAKVGPMNSHSRTCAGGAGSYLRRGQLHGQQPIQSGAQQLLAQDLRQMVCHDLLLLPAAVILQGQDDWVV